MALRRDSAHWQEKLGQLQKMLQALGAAENSTRRPQRTAATTRRLVERCLVFEQLVRTSSWTDGPPRDCEGSGLLP
jgi:hypothetical protein